jgi:hypothetical protein
MEKIYNTTHECIYQDLMYDEVFDEETAEEKEEIRLFAYQRDLLITFYKDIQLGADNSIDKINEEISLLYQELGEKTFTKELIQLIQSIETSITDDFCAFLLLFNYDFLYLMHPCVCDFILHGEVVNANKNALVEIVTSRLNHK